MYSIGNLCTNKYKYICDMVPLPPRRACDTQDEGAGSAKGLSFPDALRFRLQGHITEPPVLYSRVLVQDSVTAYVSVSLYEPIIRA